MHCFLDFRTLPRVTISDFSALNIECVDEEDVSEVTASGNELASIEVTLEDVALFKKGQLFAGTARRGSRRNSGPKPAAAASLGSQSCQSIQSGSTFYTCPSSQNGPTSPSGTQSVGKSPGNCDFDTWSYTNSSIGTGEDDRLSVFSEDGADGAGAADQEEPSRKKQVSPEFPVTFLR